MNGGMLPQAKGHQGLAKHREVRREERKDFLTEATEEHGPAHTLI